MAKRIEDDPFAHIGQAEDDPFAQIGAVSPTAREVGRQALDVVKQIPSGLVAGTEAIATFPAQAAGFLGGLAEKYVPGLAPNPEAAARRQEMLDLLKEQRKGISQYLPTPETRSGQFARTAAEFVPSMVVGSRGLSVPRAAGAGATTGVVSEAAGQATEGTAAEPYARLGAAAIAAPASLRAAEGAAARAAIPTIAETEAAGGRGFEQFRNSGFSLAPTAAPTYSLVLKTELQGRGLTSRTAERTWQALDDIERTPFTSPTQFQERYKELGSIARSAKDGEERLAATIAQERLLGFLENPPAWTIAGGDPARGAAMLAEANANWAAAQRAKNVSGRITKAEQVASGQYSGLGLENELRRRIGVLGLPPEAAFRSQQRGFSPEELRRFEQFGEGTVGQNVRRYLTGALAGRGGFAVGGLGVAGLGTYLGTNDPITSGALGIGAPAAGVTLAMLGNRSALSRARDIERLLLARAPAAAGRIPAVTPGAPFAATVPTLATIGESYENPEDNPLRITVRPSNR